MATKTIIILFKQNFIILYKLKKKYIYIYISVCVWACQFIIGGGNLGEFIDWSTRLAGLVTKNVHPLLICLWEHVAHPTLVPQYLHNLNFWNVSSDKLQKSYQLIFLLIHFINKFKTGFNYLWSSDQDRYDRMRIIYNIFNFKFNFKMVLYKTIYSWKPLHNMLCYLSTHI